MAKYGAKYLQWAPFATTSPDASTTAYPKYGTPINLGELVKVTDSPTLNSAKLYGDNKCVEMVEEFKEASLDAEICEMANSVASSLFGATTLTTPATDTEFGDSDTAPYGGLAFYVVKSVNGITKYQGVYYPKVKATLQGEEYTTKGDSITLADDKLKFTAFAPAKGKWKVKSDYLTTEAAAKTWVDAKIVAATN